MYGNNIVSQSGAQGGSARADGEGASTSDRRESAFHALPYVKLVTNGNGKVWPVDENGKPLVIYTDNSAIRTQQGFQRIRERFKLLDSTRKILKGERTQHCFFNRVDKNDGVGVMFNKARKKANYSNIMRCANAWGCPVCAAIISELSLIHISEPTRPY